RPLSCRIEFGPWLAIQFVSICHAHVVSVRNVLNKFRDVFVACSYGRRILVGVFLVAISMTTLHAQTTAQTTQTLQATIVPLGGLFTLSTPIALTKANARGVCSPSIRVSKLHTCVLDANCE